jgi:hypothetical protein
MFGNHLHPFGIETNIYIISIEAPNGEIILTFFSSDGDERRILHFKIKQR